MGRPIINESFEAFLARQRWRVQRDLNRWDRQWTANRVDGRYVLEIRGTTPAQIALDTLPDDLLRREGAIGFSKRQV